MIDPPFTLWEKRWGRPDLNWSFQLPELEGWTKLPYGPDGAGEAISAIFDNLVNGLCVGFCIEWMRYEHPAAADPANTEFVENDRGVLSPHNAGLEKLPDPSYYLAAGETPYWNHHVIHHFPVL